MYILLVGATYTLWGEDFTGVTPPALPTGWSVNDGNGDGEAWKTVAGGTACAGINNISGFTVWSTNYICYDDDAAGSGAGATVETATGPSVYLNQYGTPNTVRLIWEFAFNKFSTDVETLAVEVRAHDGSTWGSWTRVKSYFSSDTFGVDTADITTSVAGMDSVQVRLYYSDPNDGWLWGGAFNWLTIEADVATTDVAEKDNGTSFAVSGNVVYAKEGVIYDIEGRRVATFTGSYTLPRGIYFVRAGGKVHKVVIR